MAVSTLPPVGASNPSLLLLPKHRPTTPTCLFKTQFSVSSFTSLCSLNGESKDASLPALELPSGTRRRFLEVGVGLLASPLMALDAGATRIQYYATVGEPLCDLNFVRSGLGYCDVAVGNGVEPPPGELINIHYTARFGDGTVFDSSYKRARPLTMRIGVGKVLPGLDQGILGGGGIPPMLVGGKRKLLIPPELAYGPEPAGCFSGECNIPAHATLLYDILFVGIYK